MQGISTAIPKHPRIWNDPRTGVVQCQVFVLFNMHGLYLSLSISNRNMAFPQWMHLNIWLPPMNIQNYRWKPQSRQCVSVYTFALPNQPMFLPHVDRANCIRQVKSPTINNILTSSVRILITSTGFTLKAGFWWTNPGTLMGGFKSVSLVITLLN